jgi:predicted dehydrogenase
MAKGKGKVRVIVVGVGGMGRSHLRNLMKVREAEVVAAVDVDPSYAVAAAEEAGCFAFKNITKAAKGTRARAAVIATPHPLHLAAARECFRNRLHVLCEKPLCSLIGEADRMVAAAKKHRRVLAEMLQYRASIACRRARELIQKGVIGEITRVNMIHVGLRTQAYYDERPWRGTWAGEGGGVLLNQSPHTIDRAIYLAGMPCRVRAECRTAGHRMETEDFAEALLEYPGGATGHMLMTTAEHPGENRLEIVGRKGRIAIEGNNDRLLLSTMKQPLPKWLAACKKAWASPEVETREVPLKPRRGEEEGHRAVLRDFCLVVQGKRKRPIAPGDDGSRSLELANGITLSAFKGEPVKLPLRRAEYARVFKFACERGKGRKLQDTIAAWRRAQRR